MKTITTSSYSKSTIYPWTVGNRLFTIRDWGTDWTVKNKRFTIDELDPVTGASLSSTNVTSEWFTVLGDQLYFKNAVKEDFWGGPSTGGQIMVKKLGAAEERQLSVEGVRLHAVGDQLVSMSESQIRIHDRTTGKIRSAMDVESRLLDGIWPDSTSVFYGEKAIYWATETDVTGEILVLRHPIQGAPEALVTFQLDGYETGLVIDDAQGMVMVGTTSPVPPRGIGITQIFLINTDDETVEELPVDRFIPSARPEAGGGLQMLILP